MMRFAVLHLFMSLPLFENDFVLAKVLPIGTRLNITTTTAIANANAVQGFAMSRLL
jgi:hypothetical protein